MKTPKFENLKDESGSPAEFGDSIFDESPWSNNVGRLGLLPTFLYRDSPVCVSAGACSRLFGFHPSLDDCGQAAKGVVDRFIIGEIFDNVGIYNNNIGAFSIAPRILASDSATEIIFF